MTDSPFKRGTFVRIVGESGQFTVMSNHLAEDGSVSLYGGDVDPGGRRGSRAIMPSKLKEEDRSDVLRKLRRRDHE
jgi:hypothetical protein